MLIDNIRSLWFFAYGEIDTPQIAHFFNQRDSR